MIDIHSHILNNIDDGSRSINESIEILKNMKECGFTDIILTPHYILDTKYQNTIKDRTWVIDPIDGTHHYMKNTDMP